MVTNPASTPQGNSFTLRDLHADKRGAVMLMALCMACFLIGALWYIIGIGDALVYREVMQEATDHAAFTAAVVHAKGMNFISACNSILLVLIVIHLILGVITDALALAAIVFLPSAPITGPASIYVRTTVWVPYANVMRPMGTAIHDAEWIAAVGFPFVAAGRAFEVGQEYGTHHKITGNPNIFAFSTSMVPGSLINGMSSMLQKPGAIQPGTSVPTSGTMKIRQPIPTTTTKVGLPVEAKHFDVLCERAVGWIGDKFDGLMKSIFGDGWIGWAMGYAKSLIGTVLNIGVKFRYCNDLGNGSVDENKLIYQLSQKNPLIAKALGYVIQLGDPGFNPWWGTNGPLVPWKSTANGKLPQQILAINISMLSNYTDTSEPRIAIAKRLFNQQSAATPQSITKPTYYAQAEFYYDCTKAWSASECNGSDNAGYGMQWRARLVRVQTPSMSLMVSSSSVTDSFIKGLQTSIMNKLGLENNPVTSYVVNNVVGYGLKWMKSSMDKLVNMALENASKALQLPAADYH